MAYICARVNRKIFLPPRLEGGRAGEGGTGWRAKEKRGGGAGGDWVGDGRGLGRRDEGAQPGWGVCGRGAGGGRSFASACTFAHA
jgi:hypothetical protein